MSSVHNLRDFISERLSAAAAEIFSVVEQTIVQYEEELERQRRLMDHSWTPGIKTRGAELSQQHFCKEEDLSEQLVYKQEESEPPRIKKEEEEFFNSQKEEQLAPKQETDAFMVTLTYGESEHSEPEGDSMQLLALNSPAAEGQDQKTNKHIDLESTTKAQLKPKKKSENNRSQFYNVNNCPMSESQSDRDARRTSAKCDICGKIYMDKYLMKTHQRIHTGVKPFDCKTCGKRFYQLSLMKYHERSHTGEKPYSCGICEKSFSQSSNLMRHMRTHTGEQPYVCKICGKRFNDSSTLKRHTGIHTDEKPYSCKTCGKTFRCNAYLLLHIRTHTGEKPYLCNSCGKRFNDPSTLKRHQSVHTEKEHSSDM